MHSIFGDPDFPLFSKLPTEIQLQIWRYAATPVYHLGPWADSFFELSLQLSHAAIQRQVFSYYLRTESKKTITSARNTLMSTCRCARQVVLEAWRRDIESMEIGIEQYDDSAVSYYGDDVLDRKHEMKYRIIQNLTDLIEQMKDGKNYPGGATRPCRLAPATPDVRFKDDETADALEETVDLDEEPPRKKRRTG